MIVVEIGYNSFVMNKEDAMLLAGVLERAERYQDKYWSRDERAKHGMPEDQERTYHVYPNETQYNMKIIADDLYRMAKLAGKPEK